MYTFLQKDLFQKTMRKGWSEERKGRNPSFFI